MSVDIFDRLVRRAVRAEVTPERVLEAVARECEYSIELAAGLHTADARAVARCSARLIYRGVVEQVCVRPGQPEQTLVREARK